jgi:hypothetical protein
LARSTTDTSFLGARFWGQVRGSSGRLRILQGKGATSGDGKEGVDGSSPSEGFRFSPA